MRGRAYTNFVDKRSSLESSFRHEFGDRVLIMKARLLFDFDLYSP